MFQTSLASDRWKCPSKVWRHPWICCPQPIIKPCPVKVQNHPVTVSIQRNPTDIWWEGSASNLYISSYIYIVVVHRCSYLPWLRVGASRLGVGVTTRTLLTTLKLQACLMRVEHHIRAFSPPLLHIDNLCQQRWTSGCAVEERTLLESGSCWPVTLFEWMTQSRSICQGRPWQRTSLTIRSLHYPTLEGRCRFAQGSFEAPVVATTAACMAVRASATANFNIFVFLHRCDINPFESSTCSPLATTGPRSAPAIPAAWCTPSFCWRHGGLPVCCTSKSIRCSTCYCSTVCQTFVNKPTNLNNLLFGCWSPHPSRACVSMHFAQNMCTSLQTFGSTIPLFTQKFDC